MRRNDYDVTDSVRTTDPAAVAAEVIRLEQSLYDDPAAAQIEQAFGHVAALYRGKHPEYCACDTEYHDLQHVLLRRQPPRTRSPGAEPYPKGLIGL